MPRDDDYFDDDADDAFAAAIEAAERRSQSSASSANRTAAPPTPNISTNARGTGSTTGASSGPVKQLAPQKISRLIGTSSIIVNTRQKGNPILTSIKLPWEYGDITPDYVLGVTTCCLFLSLKYHRLHPEYIYSRIKNIAHSFKLRIMLVLIDTEQHPEALRELTKTCLINDLTLILAWSAAEAGKYLELYKSLENAPPTRIKERAKTDYLDQVVDMITSVRSINKTDAVGLVTMFGSVRGAINATDSQISMVGGWGEKKVQRWTKAVGEPFRPAHARKQTSTNERPNALNAKKNMDQLAAVNAKMGVGLRKGKLTGGTQAQPMDLDIIDDDEEALLAVAEFEAAEKRAQSVVPVAPMAPPMIPASALATSSASKRRLTSEDEEAVPEGVMAALAKLRQV